MRKSEEQLDVAENSFHALAKAAADTAILLNAAIAPAATPAEKQAALVSAQTVFNKLAEKAAESAKTVHDFLALGPGDGGGDDPSDTGGNDDPDDDNPPPANKP